MVAVEEVVVLIMENLVHLAVVPVLQVAVVMVVMEINNLARALQYLQVLREILVVMDQDHLLLHHRDLVVAAEPDAALDGIMDDFRSASR